MSKYLNDNVGAVDYDGLFFGVVPDADVFSVTIAALTEETTLKRGTVLALNSDGKMEVLGKGEGTANCVLSDDTVVGTADVVAVAYRTGHFVRSKLIAADGYTLTASDEEELRKCGILLSDAVKY